MTTHDAGSDLRQSESLAGGVDLAGQIEGHIDRRARGRIRDLHVVCADAQIILTGRSRTYHAKQLAQEAALDFAGGCSTLANQIVVC